MADARPAIEGGTPTATEPFPPWPWYSEEIINAAVEPLRTGRINYWTGALGREFEARFARWCGADHAITTANGTTALHTALGALGIGPGDEVIVPSYSFIATAFSVLQAGAIPVFADVQCESHTLDPTDVEAKLSDRTRAILPVHLYGIVADLGPLLEIARHRGLHLVEDCAQALGAEWCGQRVGTVGDAGCFSFCQSKTFSTGGEGGCVVTSNEDLAWNCRAFRDHGFDVTERNQEFERQEELSYIHNTIGYNFRMTEMQAAIGLGELDRLDDWNLPRRRQVAEALTHQLRDCPGIACLPLDTETRRNGYWLYPVVIDLDSLRLEEASQVRDALRAEGIPAGKVLWPQCYREGAFREHHGFGRLKYPFGDPSARPEAVDYSRVFCRNAAWLESRTFTLPCHPTYELAHAELMARAVRKVLKAYAR